MSPDVGRLQDMVREARLALVFVAGMTESDFAQDQKTQYAVLRCLEIIGEAANHVSAATREELSSVPWTDIVAQRHVTIHHYNKVTMPRVWLTVTHDLPPLIAALETFLREIP